MSRRVPVALQAGKWYVTRDGDTVQVQRRKSRPSDATFPFEDGDGTTYTRKGTVFVCQEDGRDIMRPVYAVGERYLNGREEVVELVLDDDTPTYPLECDTYSYTRDGQEMEDCASSRDLKDYAPPQVATNGSPNIAEGKMDNTKHMIGTRVLFQYEGRDIEGFIRFDDGDSSYAVELEEGQKDLPFSPWDCGGRVPSKRGWWVSYGECALLPDVMPTATSEPAAVAGPARLLPREDRKLLWDLYIGNARVSSLSLTQLIELRRELDNACER